MFGRSTFIYGGSLILHAALAFSVSGLHPEPVRREPTKITIRELKKPKAEPPPPPPEVPPPPPAAPPPAAPPTPAPAKPKPSPKPEAAPAPVSAAPSASAAPSFGLTLGGGVGSGGIAVAAPAPQAAAPESVKSLTPRTLVKPKPSEAACSEALVKPRPIDMPQPAYPSQAREAGIAGKVRVELRVDATGRVVSARVLEGLGHGLDEAALEAARSARFEPATLCGKATETSFVVGMRFNL